MNYTNRTDLEKTIIGEILTANHEQQIEALTELDGSIRDVNNKIILSLIAKIVTSGEKADTFNVAQLSDFKIKDVANYTAEIYSDALLMNHIFCLKELDYKDNVSQIIGNADKRIKANGLMYDECEEIKNELIVDLSSISLGDKSNFININFYKNQIKEHLGSGNNIEGFSWGISDLDMWTSGIVIPRVYVIGGLKKSGKTRFVIHTIKELNKQDIECAFLSLEMPAYEVVKLLHSSFTHINDLRFRSGSYLSKEEKFEFENAGINDKIIGIECITGLNSSKVCTRIKRFARMNYKVIFIDYIQRIRHDRSNQANELEEIALKIADTARENNIAIVLLSQLNAAAEDRNQPPTMGNLKGSGGIGEAGDTIILFDNLYRRTKRDSDKNKIDLYIEQRYGDSGKLEIQADLGTCSFNNLAKEEK